ncbi:MAG: peptidoglycan editing factor PgeF [Phormidesmis sp.]
MATWLANRLSAILSAIDYLLIRCGDLVSMQLWTWQTWKDTPFLTCGLLPQPHGFFTCHFHPALPAELTQAIAPNAQAYRVRQVHSADILTPTEIEQATGSPQLTEGQAALPAADGVLSEQPQQAVWACSADCTPALIADVKTGQVAAIHAGWRGTAQKILPMAVVRLQTEGSQIRDLRIALGPAIDGSVYQVGLDVAVEVGLTIAPEPAEAVAMKPEAARSAAVIDHLLTLQNSPLLSDPDPDRIRLDVRRINQIQLEQMGLEPEQIAIAPHCTYQQPENFFSYRRTHEKKVQWSGIVSGQ